jgi:hypothetical protein
MYQLVNHPLNNKSEIPNTKRRQECQKNPKNKIKEDADLYY